MRTALLLVSVAACGGTTPAYEPLPPLPPPTTTATLVGPLCEAGACRCRTGDADAGAPASAAVKRYEFKIGPTDNDLWVTVDGMVLYKSRERATECFYVDLAAPGDHPVTVRAHGEPAFAARVAISEMRAEPPSWYHTFDLHCGGPGACDQAQLRSWRAGLNKFVRGVHDPCGSTKIRGIEWDTGKMPDATLPADLYVKLVLQPYKFAPEHPSGDPSCANNY